LKIFCNSALSVFLVSLSAREERPSTHIKQYQIIATMSSLRNSAVSALAFAGGSLIAALYTHYQNKASADNDSQEEDEEEQFEEML
jgi:hypothetical protein